MFITDLILNESFIRTNRLNANNTSYSNIGSEKYSGALHLWDDDE